MSQSFHPPRSKNRCNRKRLDRLPLGERRNELLPRVLGYYTRLCACPGVPGGHWCGNGGARSPPSPCCSP